MCILGRPSENLEDCDLFVLIFEAFSEKWAENCDWDMGNRESQSLKETEMQTGPGGQTQQNKRKRKNTCKSEREPRECQCRMFWFHPPIVSSRQRNDTGGWRCGAHLMNEPECTGLLPLRMLPLGLSTNTNRPNGAQAGGAQWTEFVTNKCQG